MQTQDIDIVAVLIEVVRDSLGAATFTSERERKVEERLRALWGGQRAYVKRSDLDAEARARDIRARYNMTNRKELQAEYNIGRAQFYKILKGADRFAENESHLCLEMRLESRYRGRTTLKESQS